MSLVGRIFVIIFAVIVASIATGIAMAMGILGPDWHGFSGDVAERIWFWVLVLFTTSFTGAVTLLPLFVLIVIAESFKIRSLLVHAVAGAALLMFGYYGGGFNNRYQESIDRPPAPLNRETEIIAAAGVVFGLSYWLIAGRRAGAWRGP